MSSKRGEKKIGRATEKKLEYERKMNCSNLIVFLEDYLRDDSFREKLDINLYRMPFKDGMLDLKTLAFRDGIRGSDFLTKTLQFSYSAGKDVDVSWVKLQLKKICNMNDEHLDYYLSFLGYSMTGDSSREQLFWCLKGAFASNGKSSVFEALTKIMPEFATCFASDLFETTYGERHKEVATWNGMKFGWLNELRKGKKQDEAYIKLLSDGTAQKYKVMYGTSAVMPIQFKLAIVGNNDLKLNACDGSKRRYRHMEMNSDFQEKYSEDNFETLQFSKDKDFQLKLTSQYRDALLQLIFTYSQLYWKEKSLKPYPEDWETKGEKVMSKNNEFGNWFSKTFEVDANGSVCNWELVSLFDEKFDNDEEVERLKRKYKYDGKAYAGTFEVWCDKAKKKVFKKRPKGVWYGFKKIETDDGNDDPEDE